MNELRDFAWGAYARGESNRAGRPGGTRRLVKRAAFRRRRCYRDERRPPEHRARTGRAPGHRGLSVITGRLAAPAMSPSSTACLHLFPVSMMAVVAEGFNGSSSCTNALMTRSSWQMPLLGPNVWSLSKSSGTAQFVSHHVNSARFEGHSALVAPRARSRPRGESPRERTRIPPGGAFLLRGIFEEASSSANCSFVRDRLSEACAVARPRFVKPKSSIVLGSAPRDRFRGGAAPRAPTTWFRMVGRARRFLAPTCSCARRHHGVVPSSSSAQCGRGQVRSSRRERARRPARILVTASSHGTPQIGSVEPGSVLRGCRRMRRLTPLCRRA